MAESMQEILGLNEIEASKKPTVFHDHAIKHQTFDLELYDDLTSMSPVIAQTLEEGFEKIKTFPDLSKDMFMNLFKYKPELRDINEMAPSRKFNHGLLTELANTEEFERLRDMCKLNLLNSAIGTEVLHNKALTKINTIIEEREKKVQEAKDTGEQPPPDIMKALNDLFNQEQQLKDQFKQGQGQQNQQGQMPGQGQAPGQQGSQQQGQGQGQGDLSPSGGEGQEVGPGESKLSKEASQQLAELQSQMAKDPQVKQMQNQIKQALQDAAKEAQDDVQEMDDFVNAWGLDGEDSPSRITFEEVRDSLERIRNSPELKKLTDIIGKFRSIAKNNLKKKSKGEGSSINDVCVGDNIERILPSEKGLLADKRTKKIFNKKFVEKQLLQYEVENKKRKGLGPMIVALDVSGSMNDGKRNIWGRAVSLALLEVAQRQKRNFSLSLFTSRIVEEWIVPKGELKPNVVLDIAESHHSGGTDFSVPLYRAIDLINHEKNFRKADIVFITDGDCDLSEREEKEIIKLKKEKNICIQTIIINMGGRCSDKGVERWSDSVKKISKLADLGEDTASDIFNMAIDG